MIDPKTKRPDTPLAATPAINTNRGDRIVERGERKTDKATEKLGKSFEKDSNKQQKKLTRVEKRAGEFPTLKQSEKIEYQKGAVNKANKNKDKFNEETETFGYSTYTVPKAERNYGKQYSTGNEVKTLQDKINKAKQKKEEGDRLVKKGTMLSARINNRKQK
jgi:hypothetical protein